MMGVFLLALQLPIHQYLGFSVWENPGMPPGGAEAVQMVYNQWGVSRRGWGEHLK
jgi:hypothetical protein